MKSADKLAVSTCTMIARKSPSEQKEIMSRTEKLAGKLHDAIDYENPLIAGITLLTALRALDLTLQRNVDEARRGL